ncbi:unnamed protein product [marine sediment metagenome]|uniref:Uncharacterized protein n=1 Tax=marine sediment metagenome TaxID=412755 RepID=X1JKF3_9ZZZZ
MSILTKHSGMFHTKEPYHKRELKKLFKSDLIKLVRSYYGNYGRLKELYTNKCVELDFKKRTDRSNLNLKVSFYIKKLNIIYYATRYDYQKLKIYRNKKYITRLKILKK